MELDGRTAVVTGAASGIGLALTERFLSDGMSVVMADIEQPALERESARIADAGGAVVPVVCDVSDPDQVAGLRDSALAAFGPVHLLCNNAGVANGQPNHRTKPAVWDWVVGVNVLGPAYGVSTFVPLMLEQGEGHVVNTASEAGLTSSPVLGPYHATKYAVVGLSESLALELEGTPVGVTCLCPELVATRIFESSRNAPAALGFPRPPRCPSSRSPRSWGRWPWTPPTWRRTSAMRSGRTSSGSSPTSRRSDASTIGTGGSSRGGAPGSGTGTRTVTGAGGSTGTVPERAVDGRSAIRDRNRDAVLDAVLDLFSEDNLSPGPEEVARRAGLSVRSVHRYFDDHEPLSRAAIDRQLERLAPLLVIPGIGEGDRRGRITRFVDCRLRLQEAAGPVLRATRIRATFDPVVHDQFEGDRGRLASRSPASSPPNSEACRPGGRRPAWRRSTRSARSSHSTTTSSTVAWTTTTSTPCSTTPCPRLLEA